MSSEISINVEHLSKCYHIYDQPRERLFQMLMRGRKQYFREFWALRDVSLTVNRGETVGIIGRNGSGKSTLLQMICGTVSPTAGVVGTRGRVAALLELGAGFNAEFTGRENVFLNAAILGFSRSEMEDRMEGVLAFSELGEFLDQPVKTYSSGMYARLAFSIAIHVDPEVLIVDEALAVGDARFVAKCMRRIKEIKERGTSILFVSHDIGSVRTLCERAIWLDKGRLVEQGDVFPVTSRYTAFMFSDEKSDDEAVRDEITAHDPASAATDVSLVVPDISDQAPEAVEAGLGFETPSAHPADEILKSKPVTHWGSHKGCILYAGVQDQRSGRSDVHGWGNGLEIVVDLCVPKDISRDHLSVAFSIKDLKGTDLIVSTTHDFVERRLPDEERFSVSFRLINPLNTGKYLLVAAVENRQHRDIHYYEYVEGAHYFLSLSEDRFFGVFQPRIEQQISVHS